jgi:hypothetical protein
MKFKIILEDRIVGQVGVGGGLLTGGEEARSECSSKVGTRSIDVRVCFWCLLVVFSRIY